MSRAWMFVAMVGLLAGPGTALSIEPPRDGASRFETEVRPILEARCLKCHGGAKTKAGLDLGTLKGLAAGGESGEPAVVPGDPEGSPLVESIVSGLMPPKPEMAPTEAEVATIRNWIASAAEADLKRVSGQVEVAARERRALEIFDLLDFRCVDCHGRHGTEGGLDLRTAASALAGGVSGPAVVPGKPDASLLIRRLVKDEMPPRKGRFDLSIKPITEPELELLRAWIADGATEFPRREVLVDEVSTVSEDDRGWWSFRPPMAPVVPRGEVGDGIENPIDAFLVAKLKEAGLGFSGEADRRTLARRVTFDLTGLPPTPEQMAAFLEDNRPEAYERLVDSLLASPRFGERWAQPWLDAAGFVESEGGDGADPVRPEYHRYRDYVVRSINADKPFDRFVTEQIAGDELADWLAAPSITPEGADAITATGFLRSVVDPTDRPVHNFPPDRQQVLADTVSVVGSSLMGLTLNCARCHSHKYDPISHADYYRLSAIFAGVYSPQDWLKPRERLVPLASRTERDAAERHNAEVDKRIQPLRERQTSVEREARGKLLDGRLSAVSEPIRADVKVALLLDPEKRDAVQTYLAQKFATLAAIKPGELEAAFSEYKAESERLKAEIDRLEAEKTVLPTARAVVDRGVEALPFYLQIRGDAYRRGGEAPPDVPTVFKPVTGSLEVKRPWAEAPTTGRRLAFARWITRADHPLTARVFVNRVWQQVFGRGIVETVDNFGRTGSRPTHPELLDWLAAEFVKRGWSQKAIVRLMVTSRAYRQQSAIRSDAMKVDPDNRLLWRMPLRRLQAEGVRDASLMAAGALNLAMFGPSVPVQADDEGIVQSKPGPDGERRSLYLLHRRSQPTTLLDLFDAPQMNPNCLERRTSIVASQALLLLNGEWVRGVAESLARVVASNAGADAGPRVDGVYSRVLNRRPSDSERGKAIQFLEEQATLYAGPSNENTHGEKSAISASDQALVDLCHVLLNSPEFHYLD